METIQFGISFGALSDPIANQIKKQGFRFSKEKVEEYQSYNDCMIKLRFADLLNDKELASVQTKLYNRIKKHVGQQNKIVWKKEK